MIDVTYIYRLLFGLLLLNCSFSISAQQFFRMYYEDDPLEFNSRVLKYDENHLYLQLRSSRRCENSTGACMKIIKTDHNGKNLEELYHLDFNPNIKTMDLAGGKLYYACMNPHGDNRGWIAGAIDTLGNKLWERDIDLYYPPGFGIPNLYGVTAKGNDEIIVWGNGYHPDNDIPLSNKELFGIFYSLNAKTGEYTAPPFYYKPFPPAIYFSRLDDLKVLPDGDIILGYYADNRKTTYPLRFDLAFYRVSAGHDIQLIRADSMDSTGSMHRLQMAIDSQGDIIFNTPFVYDSFLVDNGMTENIKKMDPDGNILWNVPVTSNSPGSRLNALHIETISNDDILVSGQTAFHPPWDPDIGGRVWPGFCWASSLARISSDGVLLWNNRYIFINSNMEKCRDNFMLYATELPDGSIICNGQIAPDVPQNTARRNLYLMRLDADGCLTPDCEMEDTGRRGRNYYIFPDDINSITGETLIAEEISLYPNPGSNEIRWKLPKPDIHISGYEILDINARPVIKGSMTNQDFIDSASLPSGYYYVLLYTPEGRVFVCRWVKG